jgi:phosphatidylserine decarboxylase
MWYLGLLPKNMLSRVIGRVAASERSDILAKNLRDWFVARYKIDMNEAEHDLEAYPSLGKLFTRRLKPGLRPIGSGVVSPCDAVLTQGQLIEGDSVVQAKGVNYKLSDFLKISHEEALKKFSGGMALTYYLCPTDYHRVHSPIDAEVEAIEHIPGTLWPVNNWSVATIANLFAINERVVFWLRTPLGPVAIVMVGATNVGKITVTMTDKIVTNRGPAVTPLKQIFSPTLPVKKGDEIGVFNMGSTVIAIYPPKFLNVLPRVGAVKMGQSL